MQEFNFESSSKMYPWRKINSSKITKVFSFSFKNLQLIFDQILFLSDFYLITAKNYSIILGELFVLTLLIKREWPKPHRQNSEVSITLFYLHIISPQYKYKKLWPNGWMFVYKLSGCGFESRCCVTVIWRCYSR